MAAGSPRPAAGSRIIAQSPLLFTFHEQQSKARLASSSQAERFRLGLSAAVLAVLAILAVLAVLGGAAEETKVKKRKN